MKEKKDVLFLCQFFYPEYVSSATLPFDTAVALSNAGLSVGALCGYPKEYSLSSKVQRREIYKNISIKRLKYIQLERSNFVGRLINYFSFTFSVALRFAELRNYKSVIVYSNPPILPLIVAFANKLFNTKMIFVSYDVYPEIAHITNSISEDGIISKIMRIANKSIFKHVTKVVALSHEMKEYLLKQRPALSDEKIEVIPNWFEDNNLSDNDKPPKNKLLCKIKVEGDFLVSYFGNMGICQDLDTIIDVINQLNEDVHVKFLFAGHGNKMDKLKNVVTKERLENVTTFDFLHGQDFQDALRISDCFLLSLAEGLTGLCVPSKTYSYMMAGKPVIAIMGEDSDIVRDLTENEAGFSIHIGDSIELMRVIKELQADDDKRISMGHNCRKIFLAKYTTSQCTRKYVDMLKRVLEA